MRLWWLLRTLEHGEVGPCQLMPPQEVQHDRALRMLPCDDPDPTAIRKQLVPAAARLELSLGSSATAAARVLGRPRIETRLAAQLSKI